MIDADTTFFVSPASCGIPTSTRRRATSRCTTASVTRSGSWQNATSRWTISVSVHQEERVRDALRQVLLFPGPCTRGEDTYTIEAKQPINDMGLVRSVVFPYQAVN